MTVDLRNGKFSTSSRIYPDPIMAKTTKYINGKFHVFGIFAYLVLSQHGRKNKNQIMLISDL